MNEDIVCGVCGWPVVLEDDGTVSIKESPETEEQALLDGWENSDMGWTCPNCYDITKEEQVELPDSEGTVALAKLFLKLKEE